jgi:hypothetical protein
MIAIPGSIVVLTGQDLVDLREDGHGNIVVEIGGNCRRPGNGALGEDVVDLRRERTGGNDVGVVIDLLDLQIWKEEGAPAAGTPSSFH